MSADAHDIKKEVKKYIAIFIALIVLTVITVLASNLQIGVTLGVTLALIIATIKGSLVACHFMHLKSEKKVIYLVLILAAIFFVVMISVFVATYFDVPEGVRHVS